MGGEFVSLCPICRHPYRRFPNICQMLHLLLAKLYPFAYKKRENQILEEEKEMGCFSPTLDNHICASRANGEGNHLDDQPKSSITDKPDNLSPDDSIPRKVEHCANIIGQDNSPASPKHLTYKSSTTEKISIDDVLCATCKELLFQPVVLNCGHVYCETCIVPTDWDIDCHVCQMPHPSGFPKVFLEFGHFLKEEFPEKYMARKRMVELREVQFHREKPSTRSSESGKEIDPISFPKMEDLLQWLDDNELDLHDGFGCDTCGMYPILGERYKCIDCKEAIGFDVCEECYNTRSQLPGRFNQKHAADHRFELMKSKTDRSQLFSLLTTGHLGDGLPVSDDASENPESVFSLTASDNAPGNAENVSATPSTSNDTEEHQNDDALATM
ncbi:hypothetical protein NMG60_11034540 [Bertholletia excelsa]